MTIAAPASDVAQTRDVLLDAATQRAFDQEPRIDDANDLRELFFGQILGAALAVDAGFLQNRIAVRRADAIDVAQADANGLVRRNIDT